jgi:hypothetical protein
MFFARVSECVSIPAGMRKQMNLCVWIFHRIFYPLLRVTRVTRVTREKNQWVGVFPFVSLVTLAGWRAADA